MKFRERGMPGSDDTRAQQHDSHYYIRDATAVAGDNITVNSKSVHNLIAARISRILDRQDITVRHARKFLDDNHTREVDGIVIPPKRNSNI